MVIQKSTLQTYIASVRCKYTLVTRSRIWLHYPLCMLHIGVQMLHSLSFLPLIEGLLPCKRAQAKNMYFEGVQRCIIGIRYTNSLSKTQVFHSNSFP